MDAHYSYRDGTAQPTSWSIPSTDGSLDRDLEDEDYMELRSARPSTDAEWVLTVCDGAFPPRTRLAPSMAAIATTFPADRAALRRFASPPSTVRDDVRLVVDGKYVTSVGGGMSYEPALWLVERLWGAERAAANARGLVWPWDTATLPHVVVGDSTAA